MTRHISPDDGTLPQPPRPSVLPSSLYFLLAGHYYDTPVARILKFLTAQNSKHGRYRGGDWRVQSIHPSLFPPARIPGHHACVRWRTRMRTERRGKGGWGRYPTDSAAGASDRFALYCGGRCDRFFVGPPATAFADFDKVSFTMKTRPADRSPGSTHWS